MKIWMLYILLFLATACNRSELLKLEEQMDENAETVERIEAMRDKLVEDFANVQALYFVMEQKLYVTAIDQTSEGVYILIYSDGTSVRLHDGYTPLVSFGTDREVIINGIPTGYKPTDGANGYLPEIIINEQGFYVIDGVPTDVKGIRGESGTSLTVSVDAQGFYCIDGIRIVPEINLNVTDGTNGTAPVPTIKWNATAQKYELRINDVPTTPPTYISTQDGDKGTAGSDGSWIEQVTMNELNELIFTFANDTLRKTSPVMLTDLVFTLENEKQDNVPLDGSITVRYTLKTKHATNPASVQVYRPLPGWEVQAGTFNSATNTGELIVTPVNGGLTTSGTLFLSAVDAQGTSVVKRLVVTPKTYTVALPSFADSRVYDVTTPGGMKIGEICREGVLTILYPYDTAKKRYGPGYVSNNGGTINHNGQYYIPGTRPFANTAVIASGEIVEGNNGASATQNHPFRMQDVDNNFYPVVKDKQEYRTTEMLRTTRYRDGSRIFYSTTAKGDSALYRINAAGTYLYNGYAMQSGKLTPTGWEIETKVEHAVFGSIICIKGE